MCDRFPITGNVGVAIQTFSVFSRLPACPSSDSEAVGENGFIHNGNQNHRCQDCGRQFVANPENKIVSDETKSLIDQLLLEKIPMAGIARVVNVSEP